ncbi:MAG: hypothetical protein HHJ11_07160 [Phycicoccus sp.]|nr:hypothetical protein [Phycicoccus sp.]
MSAGIPGDRDVEASVKALPILDEWDASVRLAFERYAEANHVLVVMLDRWHAVAGTHNQVEYAAAERDLTRARATRDHALTLVTYALAERETRNARAAAGANEGQARALVLWTKVLAVATACLITATVAAAFIARG